MIKYILNRGYIMGILTKEKVYQLYKQAADRYSTIPFSPIMEKGFDTILLDRINQVLYYITNMDFNQCYKKQSVSDFKASVETLKLEGWVGFG